MVGSLEDVLGALDRLSAEMAREDGPPIEQWVLSIARRQALVERIAAFQPLDPAIAERLEHIVRLGDAAANRLNAAREGEQALGFGSLLRDGHDAPRDQMSWCKLSAEGLGLTPAAMFVNVDVPSSVLAQKLRE